MLYSTQVRRPIISRYVHVFQDDGVPVLSIDVSTSPDAEYSGMTLNITTNYDFSTSRMYYLLMDSGVYVYVCVLCACVLAYMQVFMCFTCMQMSVLSIHLSVSIHLF